MNNTAAAAAAATATATTATTTTTTTTANHHHYHSLWCLFNEPIFLTSHHSRPGPQRSAREEALGLLKRDF